jgi:hypothetical protein
MKSARCESEQRLCYPLVLDKGRLPMRVCARVLGIPCVVPQPGLVEVLRREGLVVAVVLLCVWLVEWIAPPSC